MHLLPEIPMCADVSVSVPAMLSVEEEAGMVEVCVSLSVMEMKETEREFTVKLSTESGTGNFKAKLKIK